MSIYFQPVMHFHWQHLHCSTTLLLTLLSGTGCMPISGIAHAGLLSRFLGTILEFGPLPI